jgi:hypothetical protein
MTGQNRQKIQVRVLVEKFHDCKPYDAPPVAGDDNGTIRMPYITHDPQLVPGPRQPVFDQQPRHLSDGAGVVDPRKTDSYTHRLVLALQ